MHSTTPANGCSQRAGWGTSSTRCWGTRARTLTRLHGTHRLHGTYQPRATGAAPEVSVSAAPSAAAEQVKQQLASELQGLDRGIFGVTSAKKAVLHSLLSELEAHNPVAAPIDHLQLVQGDWKLLYSTITITGVKRTKLGLREFVRLGDFVQSIDTDKSLAINRVSFSVTGLGLLQGGLTILAAYQKAGPQRVDIAFQEASLEPKELQRLFEANYDLLLSIFNPQGHLDVTYLDTTHRVGRDDKGNIFYLERA